MDVRTLSSTLMSSSLSLGSPSGDEVCSNSHMELPLPTLVKTYRRYPVHGYPGPEFFYISDGLKNQSLPTYD